MDMQDVHFHPVVTFNLQKKTFGRVFLVSFPTLEDPEKRVLLQRKTWDRKAAPVITTYANDDQRGVALENLGVFRGQKKVWFESDYEVGEEFEMTEEVAKRLAVRWNRPGAPKGGSHRLATEAEAQTYWARTNSSTVNPDAEELRRSAARQSMLRNRRRYGAAFEDETAAPAAPAADMAAVIAQAVAAALAAAGVTPAPVVEPEPEPVKEASPDLQALMAMMTALAAEVKALKASGDDSE
jgi:hypothetical protein